MRRGSSSRPLLSPPAPLAWGSHAEGDPCQNTGLPCPPATAVLPALLRGSLPSPSLQRVAAGAAPREGFAFESATCCRPARSSFNASGLGGGLVLPRHPACIQVALVTVAFVSPERQPPQACHSCEAPSAQQPPQARQPFLAPYHAGPSPFPCPHRALQTPGKHNHRADKPGPPLWFESQPCPGCRPSSPPAGGTHLCHGLPRTFPGLGDEIPGADETGPPRQEAGGVCSSKKLLCQAVSLPQPQRGVPQKGEGKGVNRHRTTTPGGEAEG